MKDNTGQCRAMQDNAAQCSTIQDNAEQCRACRKMQDSAGNKDYTVQCRTVWCINVKQWITQFTEKLKIYRHRKVGSKKFSSRTCKSCPEKPSAQPILAALIHLDMRKGKETSFFSKISQQQTLQYMSKNWLFALLPYLKNISGLESKPDLKHIYDYRI